MRAAPPAVAALRLLHCPDRVDVRRPSPALPRSLARLPVARGVHAQLAPAGLTATGPVLAVSASGRAFGGTRASTARLPGVRRLARASVLPAVARRATLVCPRLVVVPPSRVRRRSRVPAGPLRSAGGRSRSVGVISATRTRRPRVTSPRLRTTRSRLRSRSPPPARSARTVRAPLAAAVARAASRSPCVAPPSPPRLRASVRRRRRSPLAVVPAVSRTSVARRVPRSVALTW